MLTSQMGSFSLSFQTFLAEVLISDLKMAEWVPVAEGPGEKAVEIETEEDGQ